MLTKRDLLTCFLLLLVFDFGTIRDCESHNVLVPYTWREVNFAYPNEVDRVAAISNRSFVPANVLINDVDAWPGDMKSVDLAKQRVFVTTPRVATGIPATLSTVKNIQSNDSFLLAPFPNWESQTVDQGCNGIISVDKIHIDECGRLWVTDTGVIDEFSTFTRVCPPKILIYDLKNNDALIQRYEFPRGVYIASSGFSCTVTDSRSGDCGDSMAYIADRNSLVVFDLRQLSSWRVESNYFYAFPRFGTFTIAGQSFDLMDGLFGMALGPIQPSGDRILYFHSMASVRESWIATSALKNTSLVRDPDAIRRRFFLSPEFRQGQSSLEVMTENGILIYSDVIHNSLVCWNTATEPSKENTQVIYESFEHLQFVSGLKLRADSLWIATNRIQTIFSRTNTTTNTKNDARMRVIVVKSLSELLKGTKCLNPAPSRVVPSGPKRPIQGDSPSPFNKSTKKPPPPPPSNLHNQSGR